MPARQARSEWVWRSILVGASLFVLALILSAVLDPRIRVLHALQALIYVAVVVSTRRDSAWGFGAGFLVSALWNYVNLFVTTFIRNGVHQTIAFLQTGRMERPDQAIAVVAAIGHFLLIGACVIGFLATRPKGRAWARFVGGGLVAVAYLILIIFATGPQFIAVVRRTFGL